MYTLAQNKHSPGRNDTLEGGEHLAGSSDHLKHPQLSSFCLSASEQAGTAPGRGGQGQGP